jgi:hypothetical protein
MAKTKKLTVDFFLKVLPVWVGIIIGVWFLRWLFSDYLPNETFWWCVIIDMILCVLSLTSGWLTEEVDINTIKASQSPSGRIDLQTEGFNFKSILSENKKTEDTSKDKEIEVKGDCDVKGDKKMPYKVKVIYNINTANYDDVRKYMRTTIKNIEDAFKLAIEPRMSDFCLKKTPEEVKEQRAQAITKDIFNAVCKEYGIKIIDCNLVDVDYSEETEKALAEKKQVAMMQEMVNGLMYDSTKNPNGFPNDDKGRAEAWRIVKAKMLGGNFKQTEVTNSTGSPVVINP